MLVSTVDFSRVEVSNKFHHRCRNVRRHVSGAGHLEESRGGLPLTKGPLACFSPSIAQIKPPVPACNRTWERMPRYCSRRNTANGTWKRCDCSFLGVALTRSIARFHEKLGHERGKPKADSVGGEDTGGLGRDRDEDPFAEESRKRRVARGACTEQASPCSFSLIRHRLS